MLNKPMVYATLSIYSWSLIQFTLNLVVTRGRSTGSNSSSLRSNISSKKRALNKNSIHNELWNVVITLIMQDCPFVILRTICVFKFQIVSYLFLFFTFKNAILFSLQIYRIIAICTDKDYNFNQLCEIEIVNNNGPSLGDSCGSKKSSTSFLNSKSKKQSV